jgi:uncharacterized damage-inducible protein DinB
MDKADISALIAYNFWANDHILAACERITTDEFTRVVTPNPGWESLRAILVHALDTEYGWRSILQAQSGDTILNPADFADIHALKNRWDIERADWLAYETQLNANTLNAGYGDDSDHSPKVWQTILHVINHSTQHRSEAAAILTGYGQSPGELDFDLFLKENPRHIHG